jgi:hypothetical protein
MDILFIYILNLFYYFFLVTTVNIFAGGWKWNIAVDGSGILPWMKVEYCRGWKGNIVVDGSGILPWMKVEYCPEIIINIYFVEDYVKPCLSMFIRVYLVKT